ncbi:MAG: hypothetical protein O7B25_16270 [Gammaproteobacteria bacterium]|nr:hypothetical protein [Gammaproteobacteria bacterium]
MPVSVERIFGSLVVAFAMSLSMAEVAAASNAGDEMTLPPVGFFDYLGSMVELEGELLDPLSLRAMNDPEETDGSEPLAQDQPLDGHVSTNNAEELQ